MRSRNGKKYRKNCLRKLRKKRQYIEILWQNVEEIDVFIKREDEKKEAPSFFCYSMKSYADRNNWLNNFRFEC